MKRLTVMFVILMLLVGGIAAASAAASDISVVASTTWVGAMVEALGITDVLVLAPVELRHPAEYDFRPRDIQLALDADYVIWAGYEPFIRNLVEAANIPEEQVLLVHTNNSPPILEESVAQLAASLGREEQFAQWAEQLRALAAELEAGAAAADTASITAAVQGHQERFVRWLGYDVVVVYGPGEVTPGKITELVAADPDVIIDNWHSAQGEAFAQEGRPYYSLLNFPGPRDTVTLLDVLRHNGRELGLLE